MGSVDNAREAHHGANDQLNRTMVLRFFKYSTALSFTVNALGLVACGGDQIFACPPGYTCTPNCPFGETCVATPDGGAGLDGSVSDANSSPVDAGYPDGSVPPKSSAVTVLDYRVVDAKFSTALSSIVTVSDTPSNRLHIYDVSTASDRTVALPVAPVAVAIDVTGLFAAVAYDAHVSWIDLNAGSVKATCDVSSDAYDVALSTKGVAYVFPRTDQWTSLHAIDLSTCQETLISASLYAGSHVGLHPSEKAIFIADQGLSPSSIDRCNLTSSPIACGYVSPGWGTYEYCGNLWMSADGARIYSACGVTLKVPGNVTDASCSYGGSLPGVNRVQHLSEATDAQKVVLVPGTYWGGIDPSTASADTVVRVHETNFLGFVAQYELPPFPLNGSAVAASHGRFVFTMPKADTFYAIVQADPSSGALHDFALVTMVP